MANNIKCPNCGHEFDVENVIAADLEQKFQQQYQIKLQQSLDSIEEDKKKLQDNLQKFEETKKRENEIFAQKIQQERQKIENDLKEQITKSTAADFENKIRMLEDNNKDTEEKLIAARKKELEFLQKEQQLKNTNYFLNTFTYPKAI